MQSLQLKHSSHGITDPMFAAWNTQIDETSETAVTKGQKTINKTVESRDTL